ncbi:hypothetical protein Tco_1405951 [Tanacetum coccineum]
MKGIVSSCSVSKDQELQRLQEKAQLLKEGYMIDMDLLEKQLTKEILHETDWKIALTELISLFENTFNLDLRRRLQNYTAFETIIVKDTIIGDMDSLRST